MSQLDLTYNDIGPDGARSLAFCLTRNNTLRRLVLRHNLIRDAGCESLAHALTSSNSSLIELSLAANGMTDVAAQALGTMLASNTTLCRLDVSANVFGQVYTSPHSMPALNHYHKSYITHCITHCAAVGLSVVLSHACL